MGRGAGAGGGDANGVENRLGTALGWRVGVGGPPTAAVAPGSAGGHAGACYWAPTSGQIKDDVMMG